ncbi:fatty acyl-AMP ligase [Myxosarcina sp. GI1]|uniref:fatty acyl-AMP ligase n=1 Tax=Myxosarcina sp. GI1 TaxID=1541065 RepID=UPI00055EC343|nr:fatty acyl-AMP ligase [Myxosarcina sp. GI1]
MSQKHDSNLVEILQQRAISQPQKTAYIFLKDGENKTIELTYRDLEQSARAIAVRLQQLTTPGARVLLIYPYGEGLKFIAAFFGCLYAGVVAVPYNPPLNRLRVTEMQARLRSTEAEAILTESSLLTKLQDQLVDLKLDLHWLNTDKINLKSSDRLNFPEINSDSLAFLQYTSGSTGEPKGVMVTHRSLMQSQEILKLSFGHSSDLVGVGWLPLFHDMGLIGNVIQPIYVGGSCVMMSPISFVQKPLRWLQAISRYQATTSGAPNFAYDLLCDRANDEQLAKLDLSSWELAFCGAEPVRQKTIERFSRKFAPCGFRETAFYPCYGMAEATLMITGGSKAKLLVVKHLDKAALEQNKVVESDNRQEAGVTTLVSAGYPWLDGKVAIADLQTLTECAPNQIGEIWFSSSSVGKGYWKMPEVTQKTFQARFPNGDRQFLRTGDLGFISDGELYLTGRFKDVLVFWGRNHYPQHLELTVEQCHPALKVNSGAAFAITVAGKERLVIVQEIERSYRKCLPVDAIVEAIRWAIFQQHLIDVYAIALLKPGGLPKTSSGKVQRSACKAKFLDNSLEVMAQWHLPETEASDITSLMQKYTNPMTYVKMLATNARGRLRRYFYLLTNNKQS